MSDSFIALLNWYVVAAGPLVCVLGMVAASQAYIIRRLSQRVDALRYDHWHLATQMYKHTEEERIRREAREACRGWDEITA